MDASKSLPLDRGVVKAEKFREGKKHENQVIFSEKTVFHGFHIVGWMDGDKIEI
jgi:hypothetical protein